MQEEKSGKMEQEEKNGKMEQEVDNDADLRQPSINTEPRTLDENSIERATVAAQKIFAQHPEPTSDCFIKDAFDTATRENAPAKDAAKADALGTQLDELVRDAGNVVDTDFTKSKAPVPSDSTPAAPPPEEPST